MDDLSFGKRVRLLSAEDFSRVFANTEVRIACPEILIIACFNDCTHPRLGMVIAKKHVKLATQRSVVKRLVRESFRHRQQRLPSLDIVVLARRGAGNIDKASFAAILQRQWTRLDKKAGKTLEVKR